MAVTSTFYSFAGFAYVLFLNALKIRGCDLCILLYRYGISLILKFTGTPSVINTEGFGFTWCFYAKFQNPNDTIPVP